MQHTLTCMSIRNFLKEAIVGTTTLTTWSSSMNVINLFAAIYDVNFAIVIQNIPVCKAAFCYNFS